MMTYPEGRAMCVAIAAMTVGPAGVSPLDLVEETAVLRGLLVRSAAQSHVEPWEGCPTLYPWRWRQVASEIASERLRVEIRRGAAVLRSMGAGEVAA